MESLHSDDLYFIPPGVIQVIQKDQQYRLDTSHSEEAHRLRAQVWGVPHLDAQAESLKQIQCNGGPGQLSSRLNKLTRYGDS